MILFINTVSDLLSIKLLDINSREVDFVELSAKGELSDVLLIKIEEILHKNNLTKNNLSGIIVASGPGSFTGLRIGIGVANLLAFSLNIPIVSINDKISNTKIEKSVKKISSNEIFTDYVVPLYKKPPHITKPKRRV